jgi:hypothetical protein
LPAQPLACKLLIRKTRRDVRVVEGARWKAIPATLTEEHLNTSSRKRFSDLRPADAP